MGLCRKVVDTDFDENSHESLQGLGACRGVACLLDLVKRSGQFGGLVAWISLVILKAIDLLQREIRFHAAFRVEAASGKDRCVHATVFDKGRAVLSEVLDCVALKEVVSTDGVPNWKDKWSMNGSINEDPVEFISKLDTCLDTEDHELWIHAYCELRKAS